jgi:hypothetical protein
MASTLSFRNLDVSVDDPVETWPLEALATALARGAGAHLRMSVRGSGADGDRDRAYPSGC